MVKEGCGLRFDVGGITFCCTIGETVAEDEDDDDEMILFEFVFVCAVADDADVCRDCFGFDGGRTGKTGVANRDGTAAGVALCLLCFREMVIQFTSSSSCSTSGDSNVSRVKTFFD